MEDVKSSVTFNLEFIWFIEINIELSDFIIACIIVGVEAFDRRHFPYANGCKYKAPAGKGTNSK